MADGTRTSPLVEAWLELLCASDLELASGLIADFESVYSVPRLSDGLHDAVAQLVGVRQLFALCEEFNEVLEGVVHTPAGQ